MKTHKNIFYKFIHLWLCLVLLLNTIAASFIPSTQASAAQRASQAPVSSAKEVAGNAAAVSIVEYDFAPPAITVTAGTSVTWSNQGNLAHQIVGGIPRAPTEHQIHLPLILKNAATQLLTQSPGLSDAGKNLPERLQSANGLAWGSDLLPPGNTFVYTFNAPGIYNYYDAIYPEMLGRVIVIPNTTINEPPVVTIDTPLEGSIYGSQNVLVTGSVNDDGSIVSVSVNETPATLVGNTFTVNIAIEKGNQTLHVVALDDSGLNGFASRMIRLDGDGPRIDIQAPKDRQAVYTLNPGITISYTDFYTDVAVGSLNAAIVDAHGATFDVTGDLAATSSGAQGTLSTPLAEDAVYTLTVALEDDFGNGGESSVRFYVPADPGNILPPSEPENPGWVSGRVFDSRACDEYLTTCQGLAGARITLAAVDQGIVSSLRADRQKQLAASNYQVQLAPSSMRAGSPVTGTIITGPDGFFAFPAGVTGHYWLRVEKDGYTYGQREFDIVRGHSTAVDEIYLTPLDPVVTVCGPAGCDHTNSDGSLHLVIPPGAIEAGQWVTITATNFEQVEFLPSGSLPPGTWETYAFNLGGDSEVTFQEPITVQVRNEIGFAPGTQIPLGYWNQATQAWEHAGTGTVDARGEWVEMQVTHFSNYDCNDPTTVQDPGEISDVWDLAEKLAYCEAVREKGCIVNVKAGTLKEEIELPAVNILGEAVAPTLLYDSQRAHPNYVIDLELSLKNIDPGLELGNYTQFELYIEGIKTDTFTFSSTFKTGESWRYRYLWDGRDAQGNWVQPGIYTYIVRLAIPYRAQYCYAQGGIFSNPPDCVNGATGVFLEAVTERVGSGTITVDSQSGSSLGAGWALAGLQRLYQDEAGGIMISDGQVNDEFYDPYKNLLSGDGADSLVWLTSDSLQLIPESLARAWEGDVVNTGGQPRDVAISPDGDFAYVTNSRDDTVSVIDLASHQQVAAIPTGDYPMQIVLSSDGTSGYVTNWYSRNVSVINLLTRQQVATIATAGNGQPHGIVLSPSEDFAYVTNVGSNNISVVDVIAQQQVTTISVGTYPYDIVLSPDGAFAYVANTNSNNISIVDLSNQVQIGTISVGSGPQSIAISPDGNFAFVVNNGSDSVSVVDLNSQQQWTSITVGDAPADIVLSSDGKQGYVRNGDHTLTVLDLVSRTKTATFGSGYGSTGIAISPDDRMIYVANWDSNQLSIVDTKAQEKITSFNIGPSPRGLAFSKDGEKAYVPSAGDDTLSIVDLSSGQQITMPVAGEPESIALSSDGAYAYVASLRNAIVAVLDLATRQQVASIPVGVYPGDIVLSPDGSLAYVANSVSRTISVIDTALWEEIAIINLNNEPVNLAISLDGKTAYATSPMSDVIIEVDLVLRLQTETHYLAHGPTDVAISPDGTLVYVVQGNQLTAMDRTSWQTVASVTVGNKPESIVVHPLGTLAYVSNRLDNTISVVDLTSYQEVAVIGANTSPGEIAIVNRETALIFSQTPNDHSTLAYDPVTETYTRTYPSGLQVHFNVDGTHDFSLAADGRKTSYSYFPGGNLASVGFTLPGETDPRWAWNFNYTDGHLDTITDPAGRTIDFSVDRHGNLIEVAMPDGATRQFAYNADHLLTNYVDPNGAITSYTYDENGRIASIIDPPVPADGGEKAGNLYAAAGTSAGASARVRNFAPSNSHYPLINQSPVGSPANPAPPVPRSADLVDSVAYDRGGYSGYTNSWGSWLAQTDAIGRTTAYERDSANQLTKFTLPNGDCTRITYNEQGAVLMVSHLSASQCGTIQANAALTQTQTANFTYEPRFNQVKTYQSPLGDTSTFYYDYELGLGERGHLVRTELPAIENENGLIVTPVISYTYNAWGQIETTTDPLGVVERRVYTQGTPEEAADGATPLFAPGVTPLPGLLTQVIRDDGGIAATTFYKNFTTLGDPMLVIAPGGATRMYTYDTAGRVLQETDPAGIVTRYTYDSAGRTIQKVADYTPDGLTGRNVTSEYEYDALGHQIAERTLADGLLSQTRYQYDVDGRLMSVQNSVGEETAYRYDDAGQLIHQIEPAGQVITYTYTLNGQRERVVDADGYVTHYAYDEFGRIASQTQDEGGLNLTTTYTYDLNDNLSSETDPDGTITCYEYDALNRRSAEIRDCGGLNLETRYAYDLNGNAVFVTDWRGTVTYHEYNALHRTLRTRQDDGGLNIETTFTYDAAGNLASMTDERGTVTTYTYDLENRPLQQCNDSAALNLCTGYTYDRLGHQEAITDGKGIVERTWWNAFGLPVKVVADYGGLNATTTLSYDNALRLTSVIDANGNATGYTYTARGQVESENFADGTSLAYTYDRRGNVATRKTQDNKSITYQYNALSQPVAITLSGGGSQTFTYDALGRTTSAGQTANGHTTQATYTYNAIGDVTQTTQTLDGSAWSVGYSYDYAIGQTTITYPSGAQRIQATDPLNRLDTVRSANNSLVADYDYQDTQGYRNTAYANGTASRTTYDALGRATQVRLTHASTALADYRYGYDAVGNRTYQQRAHETAQPADIYQYDTLGQITQAWYGADALQPGDIGAYDHLQRYDLDLLGNRLEVQNGAAPQPYGPQDGEKLTNSMNRYEAVAGLQLAYDLRGNTLSDGSHTYAYDQFNRQIGASGPGGSAEYIYDANGQRVAKIVNGVTTRYVYDLDNRVLEERNGNGGLQALYTWASGPDEILSMERGGHTYFYHRDALGSVTEITGENGQIVERYEYDIFGAAAIYDANGNLLSATTIANPYRFTGREYDPESGNYFYRARYYSPTLGRFLSQDPVGFSAGDYNLYRYVFNNPVNFTDSTGQWLDTALDVISLAYSVGKLGYHIYTGQDDFCTMAEDALDIAIDGGSMLIPGVTGAGRHTDEVVDVVGHVDDAAKHADDIPLSSANDVVRVARTVDEAEAAIRVLDFYIPLSQTPIIYTKLSTPELRTAARMHCGRNCIILGDLPVARKVETIIGQFTTPSDINHLWDVASEKYARAIVNWSDWTGNSTIYAYSTNFGDLGQAFRAEVGVLESEGINIERIILSAAN